ncbi:MAG TPA: cupredoxin family protein [Burkholderiaceae bacterium]
MTLRSHRLAAFGLFCASALIAAALPDASHAHGDPHAKDSAGRSTEFVPTENAVGRSLPPSKAYRAINVGMSDDMRFSPAEIRVREGEKVRLVIRNSGKVLHELVLGTREELDKHAEMMRKFPAMEHEEPHMAHVKPGKTGEIHWQFTNPGEYLFGCLIPGHFEAGMIGKLVVTPREQGAGKK